jgi:hypothetical protein
MSTLSSPPVSPKLMYAQIVEKAVARVMAGPWQAGQALPLIRALVHVRVIVTRQGWGSYAH